MTDNPYQPPNVRVTDPLTENDGQLVEPKKLPAGHGWEWFPKAFQYFKASPAIWIVNVLILVAISFLLVFIPVVGSLVSGILAPIFTAGLMLGCAAQDRGEQLTVGHLFEGFQKNTATLAVIGIIYMVGMFLLMFLVGIIVAAIGGGAEMMNMSGSESGVPQLPDNFMSVMIIAILLGVALSIPLVMAYYFAPALVVFHNLGAIEAMKMSFKGCIRNILPFLIYGVVALILGVVASIPFLLGWLVLGPVLVAVLYVSYREIFID